jgi:hypothetical protein
MSSIQGYVRVASQTKCLYHQRRKPLYTTCNLIHKKTSSKAIVGRRLAQGGIRSNGSSEEVKILVEPVYAGMLVRAGSDHEEDILF